MLHSVVIAEKGYKGNTAPLIGDYRDVFPLAKEIGFDAVQLSVNDPGKQPVELLQKLIVENGIGISSVATGMGFSVDGLSVAAADAEIRGKAVQRMTDHVYFSTLIGRPKVVIGAIRGFAAGQMNEKQYLTNLRDSCGRILDSAVRNDVTVLLEATDRVETDTMLTVDETLDFIRSFRTPYLRLQLDTMHMFNENEDIPASVLKAGEDIGQFDISGVGRAVPDNEKGIDFYSAIDALKKVGYKDYLVYEFISDAEGKNARAGLEFMKRKV